MQISYIRFRVDSFCETYLRLVIVVTFVLVLAVVLILVLGLVVATILPLLLLTIMNDALFSVSCESRLTM